MRFFKNHSDNIIKLYINQIGVAIFAMFLYTAAGAIDTDFSLTVRVFISVFSICFFYILIYNVAWEIGAKDKIRIDGGRMEKHTSKGIKLGLWANSLNFIFIGIALVMYIIYALSNIEALRSIYAVLNLIFRIFTSMYLGVIQGFCVGIKEAHTNEIVQTGLFLVFSAIAAVFTHIAYISGLNDWRILKMRDPKNK